MEWKKHFRPNPEPYTKGQITLEYFIHKTNNVLGEARRCVTKVEQQMYL